MKIVDCLGFAFNDRKPPFDDVRLIVVHYTATESLGEALGKMAIRGVSAHYVIDRDGTVLRLVPENRRAWHAGQGRWREILDVNSASIGIELVNVGIERMDEGLSPEPFPPSQLDALRELVEDIRRRHGPLELVGHSDIAPGRKLDPGPFFPWSSFSEQTPKGALVRVESPSAAVLADRLSAAGYDPASSLSFSAFLLHHAPELWRKAVDALSSFGLASSSPSERLRLSVDFAQMQNRRGHAQEDVVLCDEDAGLFVVCDGISRSFYANGAESPSAAVANLFARTVRETFSSRPVGRSLRGRLAESIRLASDKVLEWNAEHLPRRGDDTDWLENDLAGLVFVALAIEGTQACVAQVGDCRCDLLRNGSFEKLTTIGTDRVASYRNEHGRTREATIRIRRNMRNNAGTDQWSFWRYGSITGERQGVWFVEFKGFSLQPGDMLFLSSDGMSAHLDRIGTAAAPLESLRATSAGELVAAGAVLSDDDKSIVKISVLS